MWSGKMKSRLTIRCTSAVSIILICFFCNLTFAQPEAITVVLGNGEKVTLSAWSFVYHLVRSNEIVAQGSTAQPLEKRSQNLYLVERYDQEEGKADFGKGKEINITAENLSSIEYIWNWKYGTLEKVIITRIDGSQLTRSRLGPIATSFLGDEKFLYGKTLYLEGDYPGEKGLQHLNYNLNKWLKGKLPQKEIIEKIIFQ
jgi:hypothetical protein